MGFDKIVNSVKGGFEKAEKKAEEIVNSKEAKDFFSKAKDVVIDVGVKVTDVADEVSGRAKEAMQRAAEKNEAKKEAEQTAAPEKEEPVEKVEGEVID